MSWMSSRRSAIGIVQLLTREKRVRLLLEVEVLVVAGADFDLQDRAALERPRRCVLLADRVTRVPAHAKPVAAEREERELRPHPALGNDVLVDVELRGAERLAPLAGRLLHEFHAEDVLARL